MQCLNFPILFNQHFIEVQCTENHYPISVSPVKGRERMQCDSATSVSVPSEERCSSDKSEVPRLLTNIKTWQQMTTNSKCIIV